MSIKTPFPASPLSGTLKKRVSAFAIDLMCIHTLKLILFATYLDYIKTYAFNIPKQIQFQITEGVQQLDLPLSTFLFFSYFFLCYYLGGGKTIGKKALGLRIVSKKLSRRIKNKESLSWDNNPFQINFSQSLRRTFGTFICYAPLGVLFIFNFLRKDQRGLADFFSQTHVLNDEEIEPLFLIEQATIMQIKEESIESDEYKYSKSEVVYLSHSLPSLPLDQTQSLIEEIESDEVKHIPIDKKDDDLDPAA